jgi:hypothetical protein
MKGKRNADLLEEYHSQSKTDSVIAQKKKERKTKGRKTESSVEDELIHSHHVIPPNLGKQIKEACTSRSQWRTEDEYWHLTPSHRRWGEDVF